MLFYFSASKSFASYNLVNIHCMVNIENNSDLIITGMEFFVVILRVYIYSGTFKFIIHENNDYIMKMLLWLPYVCLFMHRCKWYNWAANLP